MNILKNRGMEQTNLQREIYSTKSINQKRSKINILSFNFQKPEKEQIKSKATIRKVIKIRAKLSILKLKTKHQQKKFSQIRNPTNFWISDKIQHLLMIRQTSQKSRNTGELPW